MGKRSSFKRRPQDAYDTPYEAVVPLLEHLPPFAHYREPCAGSGMLCRALRRHCFTCVRASDIAPRAPESYYSRIWQGDALELDEADVLWCDLIITNPPWTRSILHPMIERFSNLRPTWLLFDADWMHTKQATPYLKRCRKIVSVGRVKWIPDSPHTGKDNACWYLFDNTKDFGTAPTVFVGRKEKAPGQFDDSPRGPKKNDVVTIAKRSSFVNVSSTVGTPAGGRQVLVSQESSENESAGSVVP